MYGIIFIELYYLDYYGIIDFYKQIQNQFHIINLDLIQR